MIMEEIKKILNGKQDVTDKEFKTFRDEMNKPL